MDINAVGNMDLGKIVLAIGSLGTAAYGVLDAIKGIGGGISNFGMGDIKKVISKLIPDRPGDGKGGPALGLNSVLTTLRANWLNGMALPDQKSVAKSLIKLNLTPDIAPVMAAVTGVDAKTLTSIAGKLGSKEGLDDAEADVFGRFDLLLSGLLDQAYQRADQRYRNGAKLLAIPVAIVLALLGAFVMDNYNLSSQDAWRAFIGGLLATPLAPVAKDLASAIQAGTKVVQSIKK
jgi:hypothetical protein